MRVLAWVPGAALLAACACSAEAGSGARAFEESGGRLKRAAGACWSTPEHSEALVTLLAPARVVWSTAEAKATIPISLKNTSAYRVMVNRRLRQGDESTDLFFEVQVRLTDSSGHSTNRAGMKVFTDTSVARPDDYIVLAPGEVVRGYVWLDRDELVAPRGLYELRVCYSEAIPNPPQPAEKGVKGITEPIHSATTIVEVR